MQSIGKIGVEDSLGMDNLIPNETTNDNRTGRNIFHAEKSCEFFYKACYNVD